MSFTDLADLASNKVGGKVLAASDDFFAPKENLIKPEAPIFIPGKFTPNGKWMDGWESRRKRTPGHDWAVLKLGIRGIVRGVVVDTSFFTGNYPEHCSIEALDTGRLSPAERHLVTAEGLVCAQCNEHKRGGRSQASWIEILRKSPLKGNSQNLFEINSDKPWTHLKLHIYPDGGVARLRVHGEPEVDWKALAQAGKTVDLAAVENGGLALAATDNHFGHMRNLLMPGRALNMGDGWETRRRRGPGYDWTIIKLGVPGILEKIEVDTNHFKGNYPDTCMIEGIFLEAANQAIDAKKAIEAKGWKIVLKQTKLAAHKRHYFSKKLEFRGPVTHLRLNIYPDGGVSRLRVHGKPAPIK